MKRLLVLVALLIASSAHGADSIGKQNVKTAAVSDVQVQITGSDASSLAQIAASNATAAANGLFILGAVYNSSLPTNTSGRSVALQTDVNGRLIVTQDASAGSLSTNLAKVLGATLSASNPVFSQLSDGAATYTGTKTGQLPSALGQTTMSGSVSVVVASNQSAISTTVGAPSGASFIRNATTNIAAAGSSTIVVKSGLTVSQPTKPLQFVVTASDQVRCTLQYNDNASLTKFTDVTVSPSAPTIVWSPPSGIVGLTTSATSTTQQYEAACTNFGSTAQDVYVSLVYCSAASGC